MRFAALVGANVMVSIYVGVTDGDWFRFLAQRPDITEVDFWQPVDTRRFGALASGELFLFKLKAPDHFIAGGGLFVTANAYPTSLAWAHLARGTGLPVYTSYDIASAGSAGRFEISHSTRRAIPRSDAAF